MKCLDEAMLHGYLDGELSPAARRQVAAHLASCEGCAVAFRAVEAEADAFARAFGHDELPEIPTARLRANLAEAIGRLKAAPQPDARSSNWWASLHQLLGAGGLAGLRQRIAFGGLAAACVVVLALVWPKAGGPGASVVSSINKLQLPASPSSKSAPLVELPATGGELRAAKSGGDVAPTVVPDEGTRPVKVSRQAKGRLAPVFKGSDRKAVPIRRETTLPRNAVRDVQAAPPADKLLPGERGYLEGIAALASDIYGSGGASLPLDLRAEYARDLEVVNEAIAVTRRTAAADPTDPVAASFLHEAYESKIDLLDSIANHVAANRKESAARRW